MTTTWDTKILLAMMVIFCLVYFSIIIYSINKIEEIRNQNPKIERAQNEKRS